jgi:hypothetical protein
LRSHQTNGRATDGSFFSDAVKGLRALGICREALLPYAPEFDAHLRPSASARADAATRRTLEPVWIKPWEVRTGLGEGQFAGIRACLAEGHPVAAGLRWPKQERYDAGSVLAVPPPDQVFDGHSIVLVGYRDDPVQPGGGTFVFRNAAGPAWREEGYARMPYAYALAYTNDALSLRIESPGQRLEAEALRLGEVRDCGPSVQSMAPWGADRWGGGAQLFCQARPGGWATLLFPVGATRSYRIDLYATRAPDYGVFRCWLDGKRLGEPTDGFAPDVTPTGRVSLGTLPLAAGSHLLRLEFTAKNERSTGYGAGIDSVKLVPVSGGH